MTVTSSAFLDFVIGFAVSLIASVMNAAGLNLLKLDHVRNSALPTERQRNECGRPMWHIGLYLYIASQLAGSTIALNFLKTQWVAPLGSIALIFNFVFAKILVGTQITRQDVYGTIVVMASVVWIVVFGGMNSSGDIEETMTLTDLKMLFARIVFIIYFSVLNGIIFAFLGLGMYAYWAISLDDESGQLRKNMKARLTQLLGTNRFARASGLTLEGDEGLAAEARDQRLKKVVAMIFSACGGLLASETLLLAKSGVKLITSTLAGENQFTDYLSYFILFVLVFTAVLQVYCLNTGLKLYDSVLVVPTFYGFYTAFGLINSTIYLNQLGDYEPWVLLLVLLGIGALIYGVKMLSAPKPDPNSTGDPLSSLDNVYDDDDEDSHEMEQRSKHNKAGEAGDSNNGNMDGSLGKKSKKMASLKKKKSAHRQSHRGMGQDEENGDVPSVYGSQRGMLDDEGMSTFSGASHMTRGRGTSFTSKSSFQSDPFRTPKDNRSIHEGFAAGGNRMSLTQQAPTHVLVDTTEDLNDSEDDERGVRRQAEADAVEREKMRRQSVLQSSLNTLTMHEKSRTESSTHNYSQQQPPRIDTSSSTTADAGKATRRQSKRMSTAAAAGVMSPSQFRAHFTNGQLQDDEEEDADELGEISRSQMSSSALFHSGAGNPGQAQQQQGTTRGHSVRWSTGSSKIDQVFEDLNPFKVLKRDSFVGGVATAGNTSPASTSTRVATTSSSVPSSPHPGASGTRRPAGQNHGRQDSFSGLPSEWDVPGRKKRHSMLFGEAGRSASSSSITGGDGTTTPPSGSLSRSNSMNNGSTSVITTNVFGPFSPGEKLISSAMGGDGEAAPSPRTSRIMSSPEIQLGGMAATFAAMGYQADAAAGDVVEGRFVGQESSLPTTTTTTTTYNRHYFTGTPQQQPTVAAGAATASSSAGLA
ncbi:hypothetical protein BG015_011763 [Linnemannia schmuckeri]|uniref:DUF803-domain-containing protein n=1 Tax=Linnemannia schmuckeri TaxID=64567 RepID=A0A9P5V8A1_9FUNG|nr:hypothetical protein BG015_011763 [Linnemannia schmuckeri]